jgi:hypothetical protein
MKKDKDRPRRDFAPDHASDRSALRAIYLWNDASETAILIAAADGAPPEAPPDPTSHLLH